jgi:putative ABC transport system permease protein
MKKVIYLLFTTLFIVVSFLSIKQFEFLQFQSFNNYDNDEKWNIIIKEGNPKKSKLENFKTLEKTALEANVNLQRISYEKYGSNLNKVVYYVVFSDPNQYFKKLKLKSGKFLDKNSATNNFLSTMQTNNKNQIGQLELFHSFDPIEIRPMIASEKIKDIKGTYTLSGKNNAESFKKIAIKNGFTIEIFKEESKNLITNYPYEKMMYTGSLILCLLIMLAMLYDVGNIYKEIAVRYMFGYNFFNIGVYLFIKYVKILISSFITIILVIIIFLYYYNQYQQFSNFLIFLLKNMAYLSLIFLLIFIVIWLVTKSINIPLMIKNKKPVKMFFYLNIIVRFVLSIYLVLGLQQGISTFQELSNTTSQKEKWSLLKEYSYLGVIANSDGVNFQNDKEKIKNFQNLYKNFESQGAFFISPSVYYLNNNSDIPLNSNPWGMDGKKVEINENYLSINSIIDINNKQVEIPEPKKNEINVLVPKKFQEYEKDIKSAIELDYEGIYNIKDPEPVNVNIIYVKNNQSYFTYATNFAQDNNHEIIDPIAVIVNDQFDPAILAINITMGYGYYLKVSDNNEPFGKIKNTIEQNNLNDIWEPISLAYSNVELKIANDIEELQLTAIYCILFLILAAVLLFFSSVYYLEINKQSLAIQWIFGYNFFEKHYLVYLLILVFWNLIFMFCFFKVNNALLLGFIIIGLTIFDILLTSILLIRKEYNITKKVLLDK